MALMVIEVLTSPERQPVEQDRHVGEAADRHADPADLAFGGRGVRVVAHLGRQVEGDRQAGLAVVEEVAETPVGLLGRGEPGVLAHRPEAAAVHRRLDAPGERELSWAPEVAVLVETRRCPRACTGRGPRCRTRWRTDRGAPAADATALARRVSRHRSRAGSVPSPTCRRRRSVASVMAHPRTTSTSPSSTVAPVVAGILATVPDRGARSSFCIFIASTASRVWPASTRSPGLTATDATLPGMMARISSGPPAPGDRAAVARCPLAQGGSCLVLDDQLEPPAVRRRPRSCAARRCRGRRARPTWIGGAPGPRCRPRSRAASSPGWAVGG